MKSMARLLSSLPRPATPRATKLSSGFTSSAAKANTAQPSSSNWALASSAMRPSRRAIASAGASRSPSRAASTPAM